jgi:hypothetical protein
MLHESYVKELQKIPLLDDTAWGIISDISEDQCDKLTDQLKLTLSLALQIGEATNVKMHI